MRTETMPATKPFGALYRLLAWTSPSYPSGAFSYSHGLEWAVECGSVADRDALIDYVATVIGQGGGWVDAVLFAQIHAAADDPDTLARQVELAAAFRGSAETAREAWQQGEAFLRTTRAAWPHPALDRMAETFAGRPVAHAAVLAVACAAHGIPVRAGLAACLHGIAANLVSAGVRLIPLGQTDGQMAIALLASQVEAVCDRALRTPLDALGTSAPIVEVCSLRHETQYTRLFRS